MRTIAAAIAIAVCIAHSAAAQTPQVSSLRGRVMRWGTTEPIAKASVELRGTDAGASAPYVATTTADGAFVFGEVPPGQYRLLASRPGYVSAEYGQRWPNGAGTPLTLPAGQAMSNVPVPMLQTGAISGTVRDPLGQPLGNAEVVAFKATFQTGRRSLTRVQSVQSDDRGDYRLFWLTPGRYFVAARHADLSNSPMRVGGISVGGGGGIGPGGPVRYQQFRTSGDNASAARFEADRQTPVKEKYMSVYYPGTTDETSAGSIEVTPGAEARAIDFSVAPVPLQRVRGRVVYESNNEPAMSARVQYITATGTSPADDERSVFGPFAGAIAVECCDGAFELGLPTGAYTLVAAVGSLHARASLTVGDAGVDGVVLAIGRSFSLKGTVTFEGRTPSPAELGGIRISLAMDPPVAGLAPVAYSSVLANGSFVVQAGPGNFRMSVLPFLRAPGAVPFPPFNPSASAGDAYVKSIRLGDADVLNQGLHLDGDPQQPLEMVIGRASGAVDGRVVNGDRQPVPNVIVALVPDVAHRNRTELVKSTSSDATGRFHLAGIPPGDYVAFAFDGVLDGEWQDPAYVAARESRGTPVRVGAGLGQNVELASITD
jgi:Carboxypeptidase regulatory-like domain